MYQHLIVRLLFLLGQQGGLGTYITKRSIDIVGLSNGWQIVPKGDDTYMLRHYGEESVKEVTISKSTILSPEETQILHSFILEVFGYDVTKKTTIEDPFAE